MLADASPKLSQVTVVVVTHNSRHCLSAQKPLLDACPHVIVVDNASEDDTVERARGLWPHAQVLALPRNLGFGAANNRAMERVQTEWALLLNPDCTLEPACLERLLQWSQVWPEVAVLAPQLVDARGRPQVNYRWAPLSWPGRGGPAEGPVCVGFACGAALLLRRSAVPQPLFDERFFLYYEDDDLCLRLFQRRLPIIVVPDCRAQHRSRGSVRTRWPWRAEMRRGYHHVQSKLTFTAKHRGLAAARRGRRRLLLATVLSLPLRLLLLHPKGMARAWGRLRGLWQWQPHDDLLHPNRSAYLVRGRADPQ
ncbi:N-acetylglucosaminyl-diphospho-decaprenol L-rhamnosyltransferase [Tepidimonas sediminis]|uniref:N-acetylglucosaminyl-diphospho-decaprenol L-rhamnosyltransferase n=1 Tax=Tepidimonas sediminis TaxID=2588941 RepID=A0A554WNR5_9BURK|nr:glycosyltransferase family 2 protein [Tepidimonas sediminis]TSE25216.1 N-acetylglucosaminyl-diphospho-decaprenol L-rhamnosyltransferase [Tepidimonas sediminis]